ncbi:MAG TPA: hypothetical protein VNY36_02785 [Bacteroidia bacterium]|jgi:hypothetical protein|nr:hypothetical protein [Bacteroidia bacterium]
MISTTPSIKTDFLDSKQLNIYNLLYRLISPNAAGFYKDACQILKSHNELESTSNLVAHLLREIESAIREILLSISELKKVPNPTTKSEERHKKELLLIFKTFNIESEPLANLWLTEFAGKANVILKYVHRDNLDPARPVDNNFIQIFDKFQDILLFILDRYESQYSKLDALIFELASMEEPTEKDIDRFKTKVPNTYVNRFPPLSQV